MTRSPGCAQRKQCRHGNPFGESAVTTRMVRAPAAAARRAASAASVASGTIWKFKVFMSTAKCIASIRASTKFGQRIPKAISGRQPGKLSRRRVPLPQLSPFAHWRPLSIRRSRWRERLAVCSVDGERRHRLSPRCRPGRFCRRHANWSEHRRESFVRLFCCQQAKSQAGGGMWAIIHLWSKAVPSHHALRRWRGCVAFVSWDGGVQVRFHAIESSGLIANRAQKTRETRRTADCPQQKIAGRVVALLNCRCT